MSRGNEGNEERTEPYRRYAGEDRRREARRDHEVETAGGRY